jgi:hypothetical protein
MPTLLAYYETNDSVAAREVELLLEGGKTYQIDKRWSVRADQAHSDEAGSDPDHEIISAGPPAGFCCQ